MLEKFGGPRTNELYNTFRNGFLRRYCGPNGGGTPFHSVNIELLVVYGYGKRIDLSRVLVCGFFFSFCLHFSAIIQISCCLWSVTDVCALGNCIFCIALPY